jgi:hypothetical protein
LELTYSSSASCCLEFEASVLQSKYLHRDELAVENIIWVDEVDGLRAATSHIEGYKVVGLDCEMKSNFVKGNKPNKVATGLCVDCHFLMDS